MSSTCSSRQAATGDRFKGRNGLDVILWLAWCRVMLSHVTTEVQRCDRGALVQRLGRETTDQQSIKFERGQDETERMRGTSGARIQWQPARAMTRASTSGGRSTSESGGGGFKLCVRGRWPIERQRQPQHAHHSVFSVWRLSAYIDRVSTRSPIPFQSGTHDAQTRILDLHLL